MAILLYKVILIYLFIYLFIFYIAKVVNNLLRKKICLKYLSSRFSIVIKETIYIVKRKNKKLENR